MTASAPFRLHLFGGVSLVDTRSDEAVEAVTRRLLMLMVLLSSRCADEGDHGFARDQLLLYLWPESRTERARNSLNQAVRSIRQALGEHAIISGIDLRLNPEVVSCDRVQFEQEYRRGNHAAAAALYRGRFLEGFTLAGLSELDEWIEAERRQLEDKYSEVVELLARAAESAGNANDAGRWWRTLLAMRPTLAVAVRGMMRHREITGDLPSAILVGEQYNQTINDAGLAPDPEVARLIASYREMLSLQQRSARYLTPTSPASPSVSESPMVREAHEPATDQPEVVVARRSPVARREKRRWKQLLALPILLLVGVIALNSTRSFSMPAAAAVVDATSSIVIFPATTLTPAAASASGFAGIVAANMGGLRHLQLQSGSEQGSGRSRPARELHAETRRLGASHFVTMDVAGDSRNRLRVRTLVFSVDSASPSLEFTTAGTLDDVFDLADTVASRVLQHWAVQTHNAVLPRDRFHLVSLPSLKAYLRGEALLRSDAYTRAIAAFREALEIEPTFALAWYRLSVAAEWDGQEDLAADAAERGLALAASLPEHERTLLQARAAWRRGDFTGAERLYQSATDQEPDDAESWFGLAEVRFHAGPLIGRAVTQARSAFERAHAIDGRDPETIVHLARIAFLEGRSHDAEALAVLARRVLPDSTAMNLRAFRSFALGDRPGLSRVTLEILDGTAFIDEVSLFDVAIRLDDVDGALHFAQNLAGSQRAPHERAFGHRLLAQLHVARGQVNLALGDLRAAAALDPIPALELRSLLAAAPEFAISHDMVRATKRDVDTWNGLDSPNDLVHNTAHVGLHSIIRLHRLALLSARLGDTANALHYALRIQKAPLGTNLRDAGNTLAWSVRASVAAKSGNALRTLAALDSARWNRSADRFVGEVSDRFLRASALAAAGQAADARAWFESMAQRSSYELMFLAPAELRLAEIAHQRNDTTAALRHYDRFLELWKDADAALQPTVAKARAKRAQIARTLR